MGNMGTVLFIYEQHINYVCLFYQLSVDGCPEIILYIYRL